MNQSNEYVKDIMSKKVVTAKKSDKVIDVTKAMAKKNISCVIVIEKNGPVGILTERDILKKIVATNACPEKTLVKDIMTFPAQTVPPEVTIVDAGKIMTSNNIRRLPVEKDGKVIGLVTETDISRSSLELVKHLYWKIVDLSLKTPKES